jgi:rod shape-determining protein MreD
MYWSMAKPLRFWSRASLQRLNVAVLVGSVVLCAILQSNRLPGMVLLNTAPNWLLIWVVTWSATRSQFQGAIAGIALGWIQDGLTVAYPSHALGLGLAGFLTSRIDKQRFIEENFISASLLVFVMAIVVEGIAAVQFAFGKAWMVEDIWPHFQRVALSSAIISSLWTPVVYVPLNNWWEKFRKLMDRY